MPCTFNCYGNSPICDDNCSFYCEEKEMRELKVGDVVVITDQSWSFGIKNGDYTTYLRGQNGIKRFVVKRTGLSVRHRNESCDVLLSDGDGVYWFAPDKFVKLVEPVHTITIDGKDIELSDESYRNLKKQLGS